MQELPPPAIAVRLFLLYLKISMGELQPPKFLREGVIG
jgi:hypothetical protein